MAKSPQEPNMQRYQRRDTNLSIYMKQIKNIGLLTAEEETVLGRRVQQGDGQAKQEFIEKNLRLVVSIAKKYNSNRNSLLDLIQAGNKALMKSTERFDPERGRKFSSFAYPHINRRIIREMRRQNNGDVHIPEYRVEGKKQIFKIQKESEQKGKHISIEEAIQRFEESPKRRVNIRASFLTIDSLDRKLNDELKKTIESPFTDITYHEIIGQENPEIKRIELKEQIKDLLSELTPKERGIIRNLYGLDDGVGKTFKETGKIYSLTEGGIRYIRERVLKKIREKIHQEKSEQKLCLECWLSHAKRKERSRVSRTP